MDFDEVPVIQPPDSTRRALLADLDREDQQAQTGAPVDVTAWSERQIRRVTGTDTRTRWYGTGQPAFDLEMADRARLNMPPVDEERLRRISGVA